MSEPFDDRNEERLRSILRAEADSVDPSPEALNLIRARTERNRFAFSWLRPLLAVGAAAAIAGSVLIGAPQVREQMLPNLFPASDTAQHTESDQDNDGGQAASDPESTTGTTGSDEAENPTHGNAPAPEDSERPNDSESPGESGMTMTCSQPPEQQDPTLSSKEESEEQDDSEDSNCTPGEQDDSGENDSGEGTGDSGDPDSGGDDGSGDNSGGDDGSGDNESGDDPSPDSNE
ncbi:hypothetical protein F4561_001134 [Lipingzhangella halophila]|uniref:Uncharacterized protein n=1 Tax=Lipingzhangella halophila TaxID=1783352 RepID=A0A7W7W218_9ACTN|nr:hypothetical protein [Lipingzhangella halophila]MBB4930314.1 hypothetical protein [Lipingzhangella halophila]